MENQELNLFSLRLDDRSKTYIKNTITWVTVLVVCGLISIILSIYELVKPAPKVILNESGEYPYTVSARSGENIVGVVIGFIISVVLLIFLFNFIKFTKQGVERSNMPDISKGFLNLKNYFLVLGVLFILVILLVLIALTFMGSM